MKPSSDQVCVAVVQKCRRERAATWHVGRYRVPAIRSMTHEPKPTCRADSGADLALVRAALLGDEQSRRSLVERLAFLPGSIRARHARMRGRLSPDLLEDVVQDVLCAMWRKLAAYDGRSPLEAWAAGFAAFELLKALGRQRRDRDRWSELEDVVDPRPASNLESVDQLAAVVASVDPRELRILEQEHLEGRSFVEIAASEGCPTPTIKARYYRALDAVRLRFPTEEGDDENDAR
jgi:RNA polymerase sigma factor (sigma-70 family)